MRGLVVGSVGTVLGGCATRGRSQAWAGARWCSVLMCTADDGLNRVGTVYAFLPSEFGISELFTTETVYNVLTTTLGRYKLLTTTFGRYKLLSPTLLGGISCSPHLFWSI